MSAVVIAVAWFAWVSVAIACWVDYLERGLLLWRRAGAFCGFALATQGVGVWVLTTVRPDGAAVRLLMAGSAIGMAVVLGVCWLIRMRSVSVRSDRAGSKPR